MKQIVLNYLTIFIIPFLLGAFIRFLLRKFSKAWLTTAFCAALLLVALIVKMTVDSHGNEMYGILLYQAVCLSAGALFTGVIMRMTKRKKSADCE